MKLASTSAAIMYNSIENGHPWRSLCIRVKESDRRSFILILDWMLVSATLIMWINLSPYWNANQKRGDPNQLCQRFWHIDYVTNSRKSVSNYSTFLIVVDWFSPIFLSNVFLQLILKNCSIWAYSLQHRFYHHFYK